MSHKVGFGFHPNEEEIILYLKLKVFGFDSEVDDVIAEVDILQYEPWQLPELSVTNSNGPWYFYYKPEYKSLNGNQVKRTTKTGTGYWKVTSKDSKVCTRDTGEEIGFKKILTYYIGRAPNGKKTDWVIHEYHLTAPDIPNQGAYVICCLKEKADGKDDNSTYNEGESSHQVPFAYENIAENRADEGESSRQVPFAYGDIPENTSPEDNPQLLPNLNSLINNGWFDCDSPFALQSQMVTERGQINQWLSDSSVYSSTNIPYQINCIQLASEQIPIHKSQYQARSPKTVEEGVVPAIIKVQGDFSRKAVIRDKVGEAEKHGTAIDLFKKENSSLKLSWNELASSDQKGFFIFQDTPQLSHNSNFRSVYLINTLIGILLFIVIIRKVILFGDWC